MRGNCGILRRRSVGKFWMVITASNRLFYTLWGLFAPAGAPRHYFWAQLKSGCYEGLQNGRKASEIRPHHYSQKEDRNYEIYDRWEQKSRGKIFSHIKVSIWFFCFLQEIVSAVVENLLYHYRIFFPPSSLSEAKATLISASHKTSPVPSPRCHLSPKRELKNGLWR